MKEPGGRKRAIELDRNEAASESSPRKKQTQVNEPKEKMATMLTANHSIKRNSARNESRNMIVTCTRVNQVW